MKVRELEESGIVRNDRLDEDYVVDKAGAPDEMMFKPDGSDDEPMSAEQVAKREPGIQNANDFLDLEVEVSG